MSKACIKREEMRQYWKKQIQSWRESGLTQAEYCRRNQLRKFQLIYWKKKLDGQPAPVCLVPVQIKQEFAAPLNLIVGNRYRVELKRDFDQIALDQLLRVLDRQ